MKSFGIGGIDELPARLHRVESGTQEMKRSRGHQLAVRASRGGREVFAACASPVFELPCFHARNTIHDRARKLVLSPPHRLQKASQLGIDLDVLLKNVYLNLHIAQFSEELQTPLEFAPGALGFLIGNQAPNQIEPRHQSASGDPQLMN
jgi:hypothetical protein